MLDIDTQLAVAREHADKKEESKAQAVLLEILKQDPHCSSALFMLGGSYFCEQNFDQAVIVFEQLVLMYPADGKASTGLYNALWQSDRVVDAMQEIKRFLENTDPIAERETVDAYMRIVDTFSDDGKQSVH